MGRRRADEPTDDVVAALLRDVVGLTFAEAEKRASRAGFHVEDRTGPGWFTQAQDPRRIAVVLDDDVVISATRG